MGQNVSKQYVWGYYDATKFGGDKLPDFESGTFKSARKAKEDFDKHRDIFGSSGGIMTTYVKRVR